MTTTVSFDKLLIAPCGINCGTCMAYLRIKNKCYGCRVDFESKRKTCRECKIKNCDLLAKTSTKFCYDCEIFPCERIKHIDKRYRTKYRASLIQNLVSIKDIGIENFLEREIKKWTCPNCGATLSVHRDKCLVCSHDSLQKGL
jgi:Protein of unknown function (DUF3795)